MSHYSFARALLLLLVGLLVWTTVAPAEAKRPRRYSDEILEDWTVCKNGGEFTIGAGAPTDVPRTEPVRVRLVVTSRGQVLVNLRVRLRFHPHTIWVLNDLPTLGVPVIASPDTDPRASDDVQGNQVQPDAFEERRDWATTVKVLWWRLVGRTVNIGLGPSDQSQQITFATYEVEDCVLLPGKRFHSFAALNTWLQNLTSFA
jgi:hypothetical protein